MNIDLSSLPKPKVKEDLDFESELKKNKEKLKELYPKWDADLESEALVKLLEVRAYRAINERQRVNDAALAVMLPWSFESDLDGLSANFNLKRNIIQKADKTLTPERVEIKESDDKLKERCLLAWSKLTNAGTPASYVAHAREAHVKVKDAKAVRVKGGVTKTYILSYDNEGIPDDLTLDAVKNRLNQDDIRQLCSINEVCPATIYQYKIKAELDISKTSLEKVVLQKALANTQSYVNKVHKLKSFVSESAIKSAMHVEGVDNADLFDFKNIQTDESTAPYCIDINIVAKEVENELITI